MNILIDAFGGDHAPLEVIQGAVRAVQELGVTVTLVGAENQIRQCAESLTGRTANSARSGSVRHS